MKTNPVNMAGVSKRNIYTSKQTAEVQKAFLNFQKEMNAENMLSKLNLRQGDFFTLLVRKFFK